MMTVPRWTALAALLTFAAACTDDGRSEGAVEEAGGALPAPGLEELADVPLTLSAMDSLEVDLVDGTAVTSTGGRITLLAAYEARGDFDADGADETAALVVAEPGGTGVFFHLVGFRSAPDGPIQVADRLLGDRQEIHRFETKADSLLVELTTQGPRDPICCPTRRAQQVYLIRDGGWRLWRDNTLSASPPDIHDGVRRRDSTLSQPGPTRGGRRAEASATPPR